MAPTSSASSESPGRGPLRRILRAPSDYRVLLLVVALLFLMTLRARHVLGPDPSDAALDRWGFGLPPLVEGRPWALVTGTLLNRSLSFPLPLFTLIGLALYETVARHRDTAVVVSVTQLGGILIASALLLPFRSSSWDWARDLGHTVDFGISIAGFGCLGAWTAHLRDPWRTWIRVGLSCYFPGQLIFSGLVYDLTHPLGWTLGLLLGSRFVPAAAGRSKVSARVRWARIIVAAALGATGGVVLGMQGGGDGVFAS